MNYEIALQVEQAIADLKDQLGENESLALIENSIKPIIENEKDKEFKRIRELETYSYAKYFIPDREIMKAINALTNGKSNYLSACEEVAYYDKETQDYLHGIEMFELGEDESAGLLEELKEIRIKRRTAKDFAALTKPIHDFVEANAEFVKKLSKLHGDIIKIKNQMETRKYTPRTKTRFEEAFEKANAAN